MYHSRSFNRISLQSIHNLLSNIANRQTVRQTNQWTIAKTGGSQYCCVAIDGWIHFSFPWVARWVLMDLCSYCKIKHFSTPEKSNCIHTNATDLCFLSAGFLLPFPLLSSLRYALFLSWIFFSFFLSSHIKAQTEVAQDLGIFRTKLYK